MAPLRYAAKFDPFLSLDWAPMPSTLAQSKERKGSNFAIWQPCIHSRRGGFIRKPKGIRGSREGRYAMLARHALDRWGETITLTFAICQIESAQENEEDCKIIIRGH